jgi:hypothetical protein
MREAAGTSGIRWREAKEEGGYRDEGVARLVSRLRYSEAGVIDVSPKLVSSYGIECVSTF